MPRKENKRPLQRGTRPHGQAVCEDYITSPSSSNFLPFSRIHRADLNVLLDSKSADLSTEFCHLWATSRNVDPTFVIDWVRRRCAGGFRRTRGISNTRDHIPVASLQTDTHDISVKRERAASPVLSTLEPAKKKVKARHLQETRIQECSSLNKVTGPSKEPARHTRAHDKNPHPACSTCLQSSGFALRGISGSVPKTVPEADLQLATPWTVRSILKSALHTSCPSESVTRAPRHVRFSRELCLEAFTAYSQHVAEPGEYHANYRLNGEVSSLVTHSGDSSASLLPSTLSSPALSGLPGDSSDFKPPWRTVTSSRSVSRMSFLAPRTPSPPQSSKPRDCSLFSPSFFSPTGSSSGDDEVEALLASSPPTSPLPFAADRTTFSAVSPLPTRSLPTSVVHDLVGRYASEASVVDVAPFATESHGSLPLLSPADIPPRVRTPPSSGPGPGSKPCTPQPHRPTRPTSETLPATRWPPAATEKEYRHTNGLPFPLRARAPQCTQDSARLFRVTERFRPGSGNEGTDVDLEAAHMHVRQESTVANPELSLPESLVRSTLSTQQPPRPARSRSTPDIQANTDETAHDGQDGEAEQMVSADVPQRVRTAPHRNTLGSRQGAPKSVRPTRPGADNLPHDGAKVAVGGVVGVYTNPGVHVVLHPSRAHPPPGVGSRPCTPEPRRPVRPSAVTTSILVNLPDEEHVVAINAQTRHAAELDSGDLEMSDARSVTKQIMKIEDTEYENVATWRVGEVLALDEDEDDEPLAIVLARRKAACVVKSSFVEAKLNHQGLAKKGSKKPLAVKPKSRSVTTIMRPEECGQDAVAVPPKQKRVAKPRGGKDVKTELVDQTYSTSMAGSMRKTPNKSATRGTPKDKDVSAASEPARKRRKKSKTIATAKPQPPRHTATTIKDDEGGVTRPVLTTESSTTTIQMRISLSRTPSLRARESFKGNKHPPRTLAYVQEHLQALGTVYWDMDGFECMELSALPWLAGIGGAYQPRASNESFFVNEPCKTMLPGGVSASGGGCDMIYVPDVPDHILVDEEDVRIRLYTYGPLPASFLDALGRAVSIRREGKEENANAAAGIGITDVTEEEATGA